MASKRSKKQKEEETSPEVEELEELEEEEEEELPPQILGDAIEIDAGKFAKLERAGVDTTISYVRLYKLQGGERTRIPGQWPPDAVSVEWLQANWGDGTYFYQLLNPETRFLSGGTVPINPSLDDRAPITATRMPRREAGSYADRGRNDDARWDRLERMIEKLAQQRITAPPAPAHPPDPLRQSVASMLEMMQMQMTMQMQQAELRPRDESATHMWGLVKELMTARTESTPSKELLTWLTTGITMGRQAGGSTGSKEAHENDWIKIIPDVAETVGTPLIAAVAQMLLPQDKATAVLKIIEQHLEAQGNPSEDDDPIEAKGEPVE